MVWDTQAVTAAAAAAVGDNNNNNNDDDAPKQLKPTTSLPCKGRVAVAEWNPRYNMLATGDRDVVFWLPDEYVGCRMSMWGEGLVGERGGGVS